MSLVSIFPLPFLLVLTGAIWRVLSGLAIDFGAYQGFFFASPAFVIYVSHFCICCSRKPRALPLCISQPLLGV
ncbi:hypothetical protein BJX64DRAFT_109285 [Aspergillus heterothallicus]